MEAEKEDNKKGKSEQVKEAAGSGRDRSDRSRSPH
jgi:hypothetical protein